ncbi:hypothetical protein TYRP_012947 [Tyrophagus putrescentiae]|nr:hypothetical protein TYRP_012947 [Tyrophagus putrescentiae]
MVLFGDRPNSDDHQLSHLTTNIRVHRRTHTDTHFRPCTVVVWGMLPTHMHMHLHLPIYSVDDDRLFLSLTIGNRNGIFLQIVPQHSPMHHRSLVHDVAICSSKNHAQFKVEDTLSLIRDDHVSVDLSI